MSLAVPVFKTVAACAVQDMGLYLIAAHMIVHATCYIVRRSFVHEIEDTGIQVCNLCGCRHGVCQNETRDGLTCCACFPATARVALESGKSVTMSELQMGDRVQTGRETSWTLLSNEKRLSVLSYSVLKSSYNATWSSGILYTPHTRQTFIFRSLWVTVGPGRNLAQLQIISPMLCQLC